ncbi:MAG: flavodoxin domain-containing protein [Solirubrobacteraceae bacterium]|jgi:menaquinone-dependent protoporphyrinogen oxidase
MTHVLVAQASKRGSTAEIAGAIADVLRQSGLEVDCRPAGEVGGLDPYDAIVLGSAVYMKRWQGDAKHFLRKHAEALSRLPFWVFSSGPVGDPSTTPDPAWLEPPRIIDRAQQLGVRDHVVFGGRVPAEPRGPIERAMVKNTPVQYQDRRDWDEIRSWAGRIASELHAPAGGVIAGSHSAPLASDGV